MRSGNLVFDRPDGALHDAVVGVGLAADLVLVLGYAEEDDGGNAEAL